MGFMRLFTPPYQYFLWVALLLLALSFVLPHVAADIRFQDTYFVFNLAALLRASALGLFLLWLLYLVNKPFLYSSKLTRIHVLATLVSLVAVIGTTLQTNHLRKQLTPIAQELWQSYYRWGQILNIALVLLFAAQVVFLFHLALGMKRTFLRQ